MIDPGSQTSPPRTDLNSVLESSSVESVRAPPPSPVNSSPARSSISPSDLDAQFPDPLELARRIGIDRQQRDEIPDVLAQDPYDDGMPLQGATVIPVTVPVPMPVPTNSSATEKKVDSQTEDKSSQDQMDTLVRVPFPGAATVIRALLAESKTDTYSDVERLVLFMSYVVVHGFYCNFDDFKFPQFFTKMSAEWTKGSPDGFRVLVAEIAKGNVVPSEQTVEEAANAGAENNATEETKHEIEMDELFDQTASTPPVSDEEDVQFTGTSYLVHRPDPDPWSSEMGTTEEDQSDFVPPEEEEKRQERDEEPSLPMTPERTEAQIASPEDKRRDGESVDSSTVPQEIRGRREYHTLSVDDGSEWARRAQKRADYWTEKLADMKQKGLLSAADWNGQPITAKQWNEKSGSAVLREMFARDRLVEYQAYRRAEIKKRETEQFNIKPGSGDRVQFERKRRRGGRRGAWKQLGTQRRKFDLDTPFMYPSGKQGISRVTSLRDVIGERGAGNILKSGKGILNKTVHSLLSPGFLKLASPSSEENRSYIRKTAAKNALSVLLYLVNLAPRDEIVAGLADVAYRIGFEDIYNLFRLIPSSIPLRYRVLFSDDAGGHDLSSDYAWNKKGAKRKFASFTDPETRQAAEYPDTLKIAAVLVNGLIELQIAEDLTRHFSKVPDPDDVKKLFTVDYIQKIIATLKSIGLDSSRILPIQEETKTKFNGNVILFMQKASRRLSLKPVS